MKLLVEWIRKVVYQSASMYLMFVLHVFQMHQAIQVPNLTQVKPYHTHLAEIYFKLHFNFIDLIFITQVTNSIIFKVNFIYTL